MILFVSSLTACGGGSSSSGGSSGGSQNVTGSIFGTSSDLSEYNGWSVVFSERETGICRVAVVGASGKYTVKNLRTSLPMTIVLLDGDLKLKSVMSFPGLEKSQIRQFFTFSGDVLPALIHQGSIVKFSDTSGIAIEEDFAKDTAGVADDGIPDGMDSKNTKKLALIDSTIDFDLAAPKKSADPDSDGDKIINDIDPDIDGDGIINRFDVDIDGDAAALQNVFSKDANGNTKDDILEELSEVHYTEGVEYFTVQTIQVMDTATTFKTYLNFNTKSREKPDFMNIRGSTHLIEGSSAVVVDEASGSETSTTWDGVLLDDGLNNDSEADDLIYSRKVLLSDKILPEPEEVVFLRMQYGDVEIDEEAIYYVEYPFIFPRITTKVFTPTVAEQTFTLTFANNPFLVSGATTASNQYNWSVLLYDETKDPRQKIYESDPIDASSSKDATTAEFAIPAGAVRAGAYTGYVILNSHGMRRSGVPTWTIISKAIAVTVTK